MPETYTRENFTNSAMPGGLPKDTQKTVRSAVALGWKLLVTNRGHATLIAPEPNEHQTINISASKRNKTEGPTRQIREKVLRYGDQSLIEDPETPPVEDDMDEALERAERARQRYEEQKAAEQQAADAQEPETSIIEASSEEPHIVSEEPMVARRSQRGKGYVSSIAVERKWSDGRIEYLCTVEGCDYSSFKRGSMNPHRKVHINAGEVEPIGRSHQQPVDIEPYEPTTTRSRGPRADRIQALAARLKGLLADGFDWSDLDAACEEIASEALAWSHEQSSAGSGLAAEREPLSADETLDRIRALLDNGLYLRQQDEIAALRAESKAMEEKVTEAENEAQRLRSDLSGLAGMLDAYREGS